MLQNLFHIPFTSLYLDSKSFLYKKTPRVDDHFGVYAITGLQGSGKTYNAVDFASKIDFDDVEIITNIHSLKLPHRNFDSISEITSNFEQHKLFIIDEISSKYTKESKTDKPFYRWLQQTRKRKCIVILITQEWKELPTWLRRPVSVQITVTETVFSHLLGIYRTMWGDGRNLKYDKDEGEYICPIMYSVLAKRNKRVASLYDTFEPVPDL